MTRGALSGVVRAGARALVAVAALAIPLAHAAEIAVLSAGAIEPGVRGAVAAWQRDTGHVARITFSTAPQIAQRLEAGERFDVVLAPPAVVERFAKSGVLASDAVELGRVGVGVAVRAGAPVPDVANAEAVRRAVLDAEAIVFNRASTGQYVESLLRRLGVLDAVEARIVRYPDGASVMEHLLHGKGREIGFGAITEILLVRDRGLVFVGPLPAEIQNTTAYSAAVVRGGPSLATAEAFVRFLGSPPVRSAFAEAGIR